ncbi:MAG: FAD/NAD(P)-binding protein [Chloroflexi bacterium]|nr:FAD/NAD(P)-binding protein [Chloroflexota bacterium]
MTAKEKLFTFQFKDGTPLGQDPGQFVEVSAFGIGEAPISVSSSPTRGDTFELCVRAVGNVTNALHRMAPGATVGIRGPFGRGFPVEEMRGRNVLFVAGGLGLVPLRSLIHAVLDMRQDFGAVTILYGTKNPSELLFRNELAQWEARDDVDYQVTVDVADESWRGNVGVITTLFRGLPVDPRNTVAVIVGPPVMYRFVIREVLGKGLPMGRILVSLERRMKCGVGKCGHCQINGVYVCQKGPVFTYAELRNLQEAI